MYRILVTIFIVSQIVLADINVIPMPANFTQTSNGVFEFTPQTAIIADANLRPLAKQLDEFLSPAFGFHLSQEKQTVNIVKLQLNGNLKSLGSEGYHLAVDSNTVLIEAYQPAGIFYGIQTLRQLLPVEIFKNNKTENIKWQISSVEITDTPRFEWRGLHLDVSRNFMPVEFVKKYIDLMAIHKLNKFHWHLTDDEGWRIEIKKYPKLTEIGAWRDKTRISHHRDPNIVWEYKRHGGYYTQEQIHNIVQYAKERFVEIMPEIEMPGHSRAAIMAYPQLSCGGKGRGYCPGKEEAFSFNEDVLREVMDLFPTKFIHVGGDEVKKTGTFACWQKCDDCKNRMAAECITDANGLQPYFTARIEKFITQNGRRMVCWDDVLDGKINSQTVAMYWRDGDYAVKAAKQGNDVIMTPHRYCYFDYYQGDKETEPLAIGGFLPLEKVYAHNPMPEDLTPEQQRHILGVQACLWTEYVRTPEMAEYMVYPRGCAMAEVGWTKLEKKNYDDFLNRLNEHLKRLDLYGVNYRLKK